MRSRTLSACASLNPALPLWPTTRLRSCRSSFAESSRRGLRNVEDEDEVADESAEGAEDAADGEAYGDEDEDEDDRE